MHVQNFLNKLSFQTYFDWHKKLLTENVNSFVKNDKLNLSNELEEYRLLDSFKVNLNKLEELLKNSFLYDITKFLKRTHTKSTGTIAFKKYCKLEEFGLHISEPIRIFSSFKKYLSPFFVEIQKEDNSLIFEQNKENFNLQKITTYAQSAVIKKIKEINCDISYLCASKKIKLLFDEIINSSLTDSDNKLNPIEFYKKSTNFSRLVSKVTEIISHMQPLKNSHINYVLNKLYKADLQLHYLFLNYEQFISSFYGSEFVQTQFQNTFINYHNKRVMITKYNYQKFEN